MQTPEPLWATADQVERLNESTARDATLKEAPLRRDVRSLGQLLGQAIREQEGEALFEAARSVAPAQRPGAGRGARRDRRADAADATDAIGGLDARDAYRLTRAFAIDSELDEPRGNSAPQAPPPRARAEQRHAATAGHAARHAATAAPGGARPGCHARSTGQGRGAPGLHRAPHGGRAAHHPFKRARIARALEALDRLPLTTAEAALAGGADPRRDHRALAERRGASQPPVGTR